MSLKKEKERKKRAIAIKGYWCRIETNISPSQLNAGAERTLSTGCLSTAVTGCAAKNFTVLSKRIQVGEKGQEKGGC